ncbi:endo-1,4-beta-xylanase [Flavobacteriaceae bacterium]|nr:endo-1,4-beta-xylanase [Flavobacteriaceae bacterium]
MTNLLSCFFLVLTLILKTSIPELLHTGYSETKAPKAQNQQQTPLPSLYRLAAPYFELGTTYKNNFKNPEAAKAIIKDHFSLITPENAFKPNVILRADQTYNWKRSDAVIEFAKKNNAKVRGHTLVWHKQTPYTFFKDANGKDISKNALYKRLEDYMRKVMQRYGDQVYAWDVVNEAISDYNSTSIYRTKNSNWYRICGPDFIEQAFRIAHKVAPNAKLFYNDYNLISPKKLEKTYLMLKLLMAKGVPIHGIGLQAHWNIDTQPSAVEEAIERFASLGLEVHITELDISIVKQKDNKKQKTIAFTKELEQKQAQLYVKLFQTFKKYEAITNVTFWGGVRY